MFYFAEVAVDVSGNRVSKGLSENGEARKKDAQGVSMGSMMTHHWILGGPSHTHTFISRC